MPDAIVIGLGWFLAWLFATAAYHKTRSSVDYFELMRAYVPGLRGGRALVWLVASVELGVAILLVMPAWQKAGLLGSVVLLLTYAALIAVQLARGKTDVRCGCAGLDSTMAISKPIVLRNVICAVLAVICLSPSGAAPTSFAGVSLSIYVALFLIILYLCSDQLASNAQQMAGEV